MKTTVKKIFFSIVGTAFTTALSTVLVAYIQNINFIDALKFIFDIIKKILTFQISIKVWTLIVVGIIVFLFLKAAIKVLDHKDNALDFLNYTEDRYKEWHFKWEYYKGYDGKYHIKNINPICRCGCSLSLRQRNHNTYYTNGILVCPNCDTTYNSIESEIIEDLKRLICHNIETGNYKKQYSNCI